MEILLVKYGYLLLFLGSLQIAGWIARLYLLLLILRPVILRRRMEASEASIRDIFEKYSRFSLSAFAIQSDKHHLLVMGGRGLVAYAVRGSVALACGDPIAPEEDFQGAVSEYVEYCRKNGWTPCIYEGAESRLPVCPYLRQPTLQLKIPSRESWLWDCRIRMSWVGNGKILSFG